MPRKNQFVAASLSASASTIFVIDAAGNSFTRLADFDTTGHNPGLLYSWEREKRSGVKAMVRIWNLRAARVLSVMLNSPCRMSCIPDT